MNYVKSWDKIKTRYNEVWALENHDRPVVTVTAPRGEAKPVYSVSAPDSNEQRWLDFEWVVKNTRNYFEGTYFAGEAFPLFCPNLGPDIFGALFGCDITFGESTSWCNHPVTDWADFDPCYDEQNIWLQRIKQLTQMAVDEAKGDYLVGITDIHAGMDALVSLRGPQELCLDLYDFPELLRPLPMRLFEHFKRFYDDLYNIVSPCQEGTSAWMGAWHPGRWYVTSCDFNCMVSNEAFKEYIMPELIAQTEFLDANIYHLDGAGALRQLDDILSIKKINGIQWVQGDGEKPMRGV